MNSQLYSYLRKYQEDPTSRVFAPLAEAYRRSGLIQEAIEIAREGLKIHPNFVGGRVALARALFDDRRYQDVVDELAPIIHDIPDNLIAQRLMAESSLMLGNVTDALGAYKMLLYYSPTDEETAQLVRELEQQAVQAGGAVVIRSEFEVKPAAEIVHGDPERKKQEWIQKVERLQGLLQRVSDYRARHHV